MADPGEDLLPLLGVNELGGGGQDGSSEDSCTSDTDTQEDDNDSDLQENEVVEDNNGDEVQGAQNREERRRQRSKKKSSSGSRRTSSRSSGQQVIINFDKSLPGAHSYLGNDLEELRGRTILEENSVVTVPLLLLPNVVLVPGQVIPLQLYTQRVVAMVRRVAETDKTFGVLNINMNDEDGGCSQIGCTAEIFSMKDEMDEPSGISMVRAKARGRQRFKVIGSLNRELTGDFTAKVKILPEICLTHALDGARLRSHLPLMLPPADDYDDMVKTAVDRQGNVLTSVDLRKKNLVDKFYSSHFTPWPSWLYKMYDIDCLSEQIQEELSSWMATSLPSNPVDLSYWVAHNLPVEDHTRVFLLSIDSVVQRLRFGLSIIRKGGVVFCCQACSQEIANKQDMFSMSQEGPLGAYVNPGGYVHEMFTVTAVKDLSHIGAASTEQSWFPGYAWTIVQCRNCHSHMGWMFTAAKRNLTPRKFWGLCRSSVKQSFAMAEEGKDAEIEDNRHVM